MKKNSSDQHCDEWSIYARLC